MSTKEEQLSLELDDQWIATEIYLSELFSPSAPILEYEMLSGRSQEMSRLVDAAFQRGQHVVVFGNRGVGKSSLINAFTIKYMPMSKASAIYSVQCFSDDDFVRIWDRMFDDHQYPDSEEYISDDIDSSLDPHRILKICKTFPASRKPIFVFDEFDRITDLSTRERMAETIKLLSDVSPNTTIVLAGIADTIQGMLDHHLSVQRSIRQVEMSRMSENEIRDIVVKRLTLAEMTITSNAINKIVNLSKGMPGYAQLLGLYSAKIALWRKSKEVNDYDIFNSLDYCLQDVGSTTSELYADTVQSTRKNSNYASVLLACALSAQDDFGRFSASDVIEPLSGILDRKVTIPDFNRHLVSFTSKRGPVLRRKGTSGNFKYSFIEPRMQSYVLMYGIKEKLVSFNFIDEPSESQIIGPLSPSEL